MGKQYRSSSIVLALSVATAMWFAGCASGDPEGNCSPGDSGCTADADVNSIDASTPSDAGVEVDAGPMLGFGEPCNDRNQCASEICIFSGIGGVCTDFCINVDCPEGFGCFGVLGINEPGEVAEVCVPINSQLCSPCETDSECAAAGSDLCLENDDGRSFCAIDCSTVDCPDDYTCSDVTVEGLDFRQCLPDSNACDCTETQDGLEEGCDIPTDFGVCAGTRTCGGAGGWESCEPPSTIDLPDGSFVDSNCDGIDGDVLAGIFVSESVGTDGPTCGLNYFDPCLSISFGIIRALQSGRGEVYIQRGTYAEVVALVNGIDLYGGFDINWQRGVHTEPEHRVTVIGGQDNGAGGDGQYLTIRAHNLVVSTIVADMEIIGPDAAGSDVNGARSSYALHVMQSPVDLQRVSIVGGAGSSGLQGALGFPTSSANATGGMAGNSGGNANEFTTDCNDSSRGAGGGRGINSCGAGGATNAGRGGDGGRMDGDCDCFLGACVCGPCGATNGIVGASASSSGAGFGTGGSGGSGGDSCGNPNGGVDGRVVNGSGGFTSDNSGYLADSARYWYARNGTTGGIGSNGSGGGGGGGSGGCDDGIDSYGAGGGGGGAGGCRANSAGGGGKGGGGSFGIFAVNGATVTAIDCDVQGGAAGAGGNGGSGGHGQRGANGANGGLANGDSKAGGGGGDGGHGGHGGGGGAGPGGISVGVFTFSSSVTHDCQFSGGSGGTGGTGGVSAPNAPTADRDGNNGGDGPNGGVIAESVCATASDC